MIKYLELTAPEKSEFRQVKIVSVEISEGDQIAIGDTLFKVKSGDKEIDLPSTMEGRVAEIIAMRDENISVMTPLILLETEVEGSTATPPLNVDEQTTSPAKAKEPSAAAEPSANKEPSATKQPAAGEKSDQSKSNKKKKTRKKAHRQQSLNLNPDSPDPEHQTIHEPT
nr:hypothetical protein [Acidiferrobacterales bacterium]